MIASLFLTVIFLFLFLLPIRSEPIPLHHSRSSLPLSFSNIETLVAFGDSYTYVQGTHGYVNYTFIGTSSTNTNYSFSATTLLTDEIVPGQLGTSAGGPNWVEYLTGCFEGLPVDCATDAIVPWDFAYAGADVSSAILPAHHAHTLPFVSQVAQFLEYGLGPLLANTSTLSDPSEAIVAIWMGINDVNDSGSNSSITSFPEFYTKIINVLLDTTTKLVASRSVEVEGSDGVNKNQTFTGFRKFLFLNLPPLERRPGFSSKSHPNKTQVAAWNKILEEKVTQWGQEVNENGWTKVFDVHTALESVMDNHTAYGISNITGYCPNYDAPDISTNYTKYGCLPIEEYFWYNKGHITWRVHEILAGILKKYLSQ